MRVAHHYSSAYPGIPLIERRAITDRSFEAELPILGKGDVGLGKSSLAGGYMKGCRPLSDSEAAQVLESLSHGPFKLRNRALFLLGLRSGFRISELCSMTIGHVFQHGHFVSQISVQRKNMKGKKEGRTVPLHPEAREALIEWVNFGLHGKPVTSPLFLSRNGNPMHRRTAWEMLKKAYAKCGLSGKLGTHTMRKTFARRVHEKLGKDLVKTQKAMGHRSINSTVSYLSFNEEEIDDAILKS